MIGKLIKLLYSYILKKKYKYNRQIFDALFQDILRDNPNLADIKNSEKMKIWFEKWSVFGYPPTINGWRAFHSYMNENVDFVPNDVARNFIEPILTPEEFQPFYNDKNSFNLFLDKEWMPKTYLRSINGFLYDGDYRLIKYEDFSKIIEGEEKLIVKSSKDLGGHGIVLFKRNEQGDFIDGNNNKLTLSYLEKTYKTDYLVQECMKQSVFMSQFNPTSVNTLRVAVYRNVKTGELDILNSVIRIGGKGAFVDNACSGGSFVSVDNNGKLGKFACNKYGKIQKIYNGIDFENLEFVIPNFDKIKDLVFNVARRMPHMNLFANDIAIDENGNPKLIEVNTTRFTCWLYQYHGNSVFGKYTDELIEYCVKNQEKIRPKIILKSN